MAYFAKSVATKNWTRVRFFEACWTDRMTVDFKHVDCNSGRVSVSGGPFPIYVYPDNTCLRSDVRLDLAEKMSFRDVAKAWGWEK